MAADIAWRNKKQQKVMGTFKVKDAEESIRECQRRHPNSKAATKALNGDCTAIMKLCERVYGMQGFTEAD